MPQPTSRIDWSLIPEYVPKDMVLDFRNHLWACFKHMGLGEPTLQQYAIAESFQNWEVDMQMQAGRGAGKSTVAACLASWFLLLDPNCNVMILSATGIKAIQFMSQVRKILDLVPYMAHLQPKVNEMDNATAFNVGCMTIEGRQDPSCFAKGITSQITGNHALFIIVDDVEIEGNCETAAQRDKLLHRLKELEQIRNEGGRVIFLGTPQTGESIYNKLAESYPVIKFPVEMPDKNNPDEVENVAPYILELNLEPGDTTHPERFSREVLDRRLARIGATQYDLHYKLVTKRSDRARFPLRLQDLIIIDADRDLFPEKIVWSSAENLQDIPSYGLRGDYLKKPMWVSDRMVEYADKCLFIDPSGSGADETCMVAAGTCNGYVIIFEVAGSTDGFGEGTMRKVCEMLVRWGIRKVRAEDNYGSGMFRSLLTPYVARVIGECDIRGFPNKGQKEQRICDTLEPVMNSHRLVFTREAIADRETQIQITRITRKRGALKNDDRVDNLANAVLHWSRDLEIDADVTVASSTDKELRRIMRELQMSGRAWGDLDPKRKGCVIVHNAPQEPKVPSVLDMLKTRHRLRKR